MKAIGCLLRKNWKIIAWTEQDIRYPENGGQTGSGEENEVAILEVLIKGTWTPTLASKLHERDFTFDVGRTCQGHEKTCKRRIHRRE